MRASTVATYKAQIYLHVVLFAAKESCEVMEQEVARLNQLNQDLKSTCQQVQATVDELSRYSHCNILEFFCMWS